VTYRLAESTIGTFESDIIAGTGLGETFLGRRGDDFIDAGQGDDSIAAGAGNDTVFGDEGADTIRGGSGNDWLFGGIGDDFIHAGSGNDWVETGEGNNTVKLGAGVDLVYAGNGDDIIFGNAGADWISAALGNDTIYGGKEGDTYVFGYDRAALGSTNQWGHNVVEDRGNKPYFDTSVGRWRYDTLDFYGLYGPSDGNIQQAIAKISTDRVGDDMVIATMDGLSSVTVSKQFATGNQKFFIEQVKFTAGYWSAALFRIGSAEHENIGDDRGGKAVLNEFLFGTAGDDQIFSDAGLNLIWTGAGADTLIYKESDPHTPIYDRDGNWVSYGVVWDTVMDFDVTTDHFDFTQIAGLTFADLTVSSDAEGDAVIAWDSGSIDIADIHIELRGVTAAEVTPGLFSFA